MENTRNIEMLPKINNYLSNVQNPAKTTSKGLYPINSTSNPIGGFPGINLSDTIGKISTGANLLNNLGAAFIKKDENTSSDLQRQIGNLALQFSNPYAKAAGAL